MGLVRTVRVCGPGLCAFSALQSRFCVQSFRGGSLHRGELFIMVGLFHYGGSFGWTVVGLVSLRSWGDSLIFSSNKIYL